MECSTLSESGSDMADEPPAEPNENESAAYESTDIQCKCNANLKSNDLVVTHLMHLMNHDDRKKSTGANRICCERRMKCCHPNVNGLMHSLKRLLLWLNAENECQHMWHLSQKLIDDNVTDWLRGILRCECFPGAGQLVGERSYEEYELNGSLSFEMIQNAIERMNITKSPANQKTEENPHVNILILGAGLAGLGAATAISNSKRKFTYKILEAQREAGGRVKSVSLINYYKKCSDPMDKEVRPEKRMDAGAQWLHGRYNYLYTIADKYDLLTADQSEEGLGVFLYAGGRPIDGFFVKKIDFQIGKLLKECEQFAHQPTHQQVAKIRETKSKTNTKTKPKTYPKSVGNFLRKHFQNFIRSELGDDNDKECARDIFDWHQRFQIIDNSCLSLDQLSAKYWGKYSFNGESCQAHYNFENGFQSCVDAILNELNDNDAEKDDNEDNQCQIHYSKHVIEIQINDDKKKDQPLKSLNIINNVGGNKCKTNLANISVKCADGSFYTADHVLVTFPLGILKKSHQQLFIPGLPQQMRTAIDSLGYETINKIFLEFDAPWWNDLDGIQFIYEDNHQEENDHGENKKKHWTRYITGFDVLKPNNPNVLLGWVGGVGALDMETLSDKQIIDDCIQLLSRFTNIDVPPPTRYFCTRWHSNPFVNGAYSYISTNCDDNETISENWLNQKLTIEDFYPTSSVITDEPTGHNDLNFEEENHKLFANSKLPIVLFAGEACHEKYFSTAHGAFLSGIEQAQKFMDSYI